MIQENSSLQAATGPKIPSVMRYARVQSILEHDPSLKELLGPKDQEVKKRNGEKHFYSRGVFMVTNALHERNIDAHQASQPMVIGLAHLLLKNAAVKSAPVIKRTEPKPEPKLKVKPEPKPEPKPKPKLKAKPEPKLKAKPEPKLKVKPSPASPVSKKADVKSQVPAVPAVVLPAPAAVAGEPTKPAFVYYIYGNALSLAVSLAKMLEVGDRLPGAEQRQETVGKIIDQLIPLRDTAVPMPKDLTPAVTNAKTSAPKG